MKTILLLVFSLVCSNSYSQSGFTYPSLQVEYDSAVVFRNLKLIPIKRTGTIKQDKIQDLSSMITLKQGLQQGKVKISERGNYMVDNINVLLIENSSNKPLFLRSGDLVTGGRQDRAIAKDTVLMPGKKVHTIPVYCIEETRWSTHQKKFSYSGSASAELHQLIDSAHHQSKVWELIRQQLKLAKLTSTSSYAALLNQQKMLDSSNAYIRFFTAAFQQKDSSIIGIIASTGDRVLGADVFANPGLFYQFLPSLLTQYSITAIQTGKAANIQHRFEVQYADQMLSANTQSHFIDKNGKRFFYQNNLIWLTGYSIHH